MCPTYDLSSLRHHHHRIWNYAPLVFLQKAFYAYLVLGIGDDRAR